MISLHPQYIIDNAENKKSVILPLNEWELLLDNMEELDDIRAYDLAKSDDDEIITFEQALKENNKKS